MGGWGLGCNSRHNVSALYCSCFGSLVHALVGWFELPLVMTEKASNDKEGTVMFLK